MAPEGVSSPALGGHSKTHGVQFTDSRGPAEHRVRVHERPLAPRHAAEAFVAAHVRFLGGCARSGMPLRGRGARFEMLRSEAYLGRWFSPLATQTAGSVLAELQYTPAGCIHLPALRSHRSDLCLIRATCSTSAALTSPGNAPPNAKYLRLERRSSEAAGVACRQRAQRW